MKMEKQKRTVTDGNRRNNEYFYNGNGGEYFLMASLSRRKLDAFKLPVDYGFDVMALPPLYKGTGSPYYFQVKTVYVRDLKPSVLMTKNGKRNVVHIPVKLKTDTLELMKNDTDKALIVYVYDESRHPAGLEKEDCPSFYFWINGEGMADYAPYLVQEERSDYVVCWVNIVYPETPDRFSDEENSQNTYVTLGPDFLKKTGDGTPAINTRKTDQPWAMYHTMKDSGGKYFRLSGFFEEAGKGGAGCTTN